jgi:hypothetical protein
MVTIGTVIPYYILLRTIIREKRRPQMKFGNEMKKDA